MDKNSNQDLTVLTAEQAARVAGGLVISPVGHVCNTCTSGRLQLFQNEVARAAKA